MRTFDVIYIAMWCFVVAIFLLVYSNNIWNFVLRFVPIKGTGTGMMNGGNKKRRKRKRKTV